MTLAERLRWLEVTSRAARAVAQGHDTSEEIAESDAAPPAEEALSLLALLAEMGTPELEERWSEPPLVACLLRDSGGRRLVVIERTYREGIAALPDPTEAEIAAGRAGRLWKLWNSERARPLTGAI